MTLSAGSVDPTFGNPLVADSYTGVNSAAMQSDGKVLIGGYFALVGGAARRGIARLNADGSLDPSFDPGLGVDGMSATVSAIALQADGKVLIGGSFVSVGGAPRNGLARLNTDGSLDIGFDPGVASSDGGHVTVFALALQGDKVLLGGYFASVGGATRNGFARLNADGSVDTGFDPGAGATDANGYASGLSSMVCQGDKVFVGGSFALFNGTPRPGLVRLNADGSVDLGFDPGAGAAITGTSVASLAAQGDGKVLVGGSLTFADGTTRNGVVRLDTDGGMDAGFTPAVASSYGGGGGAVTAVALQGSQVLIGGVFNLIGSSYGTDLARLNADGSVDASFAAPGLSVDGVSNSPIAFLVASGGGKVICGGSFNMIGGALHQGIARLNADGSLDATFGDPAPLYGGLVVTTAVQPDGKVLIVGGFTSVGGVARRSLARLNVDGSVDANFNPSLGAYGIALYGNGSTYGGVNSVAVQPDGEIIVAGSFLTSFGAPRNLVMRLNPDGSVDPGFDPGDGPMTLPPQLPFVSSATVQEDGKILIQGGFTSVDGTQRIGFARLNADGSLDLGFDPGAARYGSASLALQDDGKILVSGGYISADDTQHNGLLRLNTDGSVDAGFNPDISFDPGTGNYSEGVSSAALQADGKILVVEGYLDESVQQGIEASSCV